MEPRRQCKCKAQGLKRHHQLTSSSSSSDSSSSSTSSLEARKVPLSSRHHRYHSSSSSGSSTDSSLISCVPTPARRMVKKIKRGEYADFDKLLISPTDDAMPGQAVVPKKSRKAKQKVCDLPSWMKAWITFLAIRIQMAPKTVLQLVKYQTDHASCASCVLLIRLHWP